MRARLGAGVDRVLNQHPRPWQGPQWRRPPVGPAEGTAPEEATARTTLRAPPGPSSGTAAQAAPPAELSGDQDFGTVISPEMIFCLYSSSLLLMSSMWPPVVE